MDPHIMTTHKSDNSPLTNADSEPEKPHFTPLQHIKYTLLLYFRLAIQFVLGIALLTLGIYVSTKLKEKRINDNAQEYRSMEHNVKKYYHSKLITNDDPSNPTAHPASKHTSSNFINEYELLLKDYIDRIYKLNSDYMQELRNIKFDSVLNAKDITRDTLFDRKSTVRKAKEIADKYENANFILIQDMKDKIQSLSISRNSDFMDGFNSSIDISIKRLRENWSYEKQIIQEYENIILLLAVSKQWEVEEDKIAFYNDDDLQAVNSCFDKIDALAQKKDALKKLTISDLDNSM